MSIYLIDNFGCEHGPHEEETIHEHLRINNDTYFIKYRQGDKIDYVCNLCNDSNIFEWIAFDRSYVKYIGFDLSNETTTKIMNILRNDIDNLKLFVGKINKMSANQSYEICKIDKTLIGSINYKFITSKLIEKLVGIYSNHEFINYIPINKYTLYRIMSLKLFSDQICNISKKYNYYQSIAVLLWHEYNVNVYCSENYKEFKQCLIKKGKQFGSEFKQLKYYNIPDKTISSMCNLCNVKIECTYLASVKKTQLTCGENGSSSQHRHTFTKIGLINYYQQCREKLINIIKENIDHNLFVPPLITIIQKFPTDIIIDIINNIEFKIQSPSELFLACQNKKYAVVKFIQK